MTDHLLEIAIVSPFVFRLLRGIERFSINLANELAKLGQHVTLLTWDGPVKNTATLIAPDVRVIRLPTVRYYEAKWATIFYALEFLRHRYDIVNLFFAGYGEAGSVRAGKRRQNFAVNFIVDYPPDLVPHRFREFQTTGLVSQLDHVIVKTRALVPVMDELFGRPITVLPSGIDADYFSPDAAARAHARSELGIAPDEKALLTVAALEGRKGVRDIISAMPLLQGHKLHYLIVGDGPDRAELTEQIRQAGLGAQVRLMGVQSDVRPFYRAADLFLLPSYGEAFPNALLEAMAMGLASVVSDQPPYDELVTSEFGVHVPIGAPKTMAAKVDALLQDTPRRAAMGKAARVCVLAKYNWAMVAARYLEFFENGGSSNDMNHASNSLCQTDWKS